MRFLSRLTAVLAALAFTAQPVAAQSVLRDAETEAFLQDLSAPLVEAAGLAPGNVDVVLVFMAVWSLLVYSPVAHWVWEPGGWMFEKGVLDFAGGTVVHINAGVAGLVCAFVLGKRVGFGREAMPPHNLVLTLIGASMLWVGWFGRIYGFFLQ